ncbi:uncharacterized protein RHOBADRAFT_55067 [Rhodotorula graminis WP1]|uniref:Nucleotide-diphospho-sugar transferase domain-containing protein n=1 Tax=Rhodotorula graminis (strain WP1) TaxID=578459 RepID=A0A0P9EN15_RHOGW|nr:uncharacterized protein RHOBADRAFT_55067 [Rhodotorula graminis WP1]KPV73305.1 hypothetical protein RHOBADRAFT_55067 [Rhodotorula graminis WP1]
MPAPRTAPLEAHRLVPLLSPSTTASTPLDTAPTSPDQAGHSLLGNTTRPGDDDGWAVERPPLKRDYLDDDGLLTRLAARVPLLRAVAHWRPDARRARSVAVLAVGLATLGGILVTTAAAGHLRHLADDLEGASGWRDKLSGAAHGVTGWLWGAEEPWRRPMRVERDPTVSLGDYLANISFVPFPVPASTSSILATSNTTNGSASNDPDSYPAADRRRSTTPLPHPSYSTTDDRNVVLLTMCDGRYVHAVRIWALRARDLGLHRDNVVVLCLDAACLDEAEAHGLHAYGGFVKEAYASRVPVVGQGLEVPDLPPLDASSSRPGGASGARILDKREGRDGGAERGAFMQYIKFRALYEINAAGFASLFFEADTALTKNPFVDSMRPLVAGPDPSSLGVAPADLSIDERRRMPSPFALPRAHVAAAAEDQAAAAAAASDASLVDPEGLDPGWDMLMTQDGWHVANFGFFLMRPTMATTLFWRSTLRQYVARGGWDQEVVAQSVHEHGWTQQWLPGWWEEGESAANETTTEAPTTYEERNRREQWHFVDELDGLRDGERLRIAMLPLSQFFAYHVWLFGWWKPPPDLPDPVVHHMTAINYQMRNFWPKERGWYSDIDGYYSHPRPLLVPWNATHAPEVAVVEGEPSSPAPANRTLYSRDEPDFAASTLTGTSDDLLHYARILQLLGAVSTTMPVSNQSSQGEFADGSSRAAGSADTFAVKLPGKLHIVREWDTIEQDSTRLLDLDAAVRASVDVVEPAFFKHAAPFLSPGELTAWTSTRLRISLAAFDSPIALVSHLRDVLAPYLGSTAAGFPARGVVVELSDWEATLGWSLDDLDAEERAGGIDEQGFEALRTSRRCQGWERVETIPFLWCTAEE